ncbi:MAG: MarR family transcriptional regulator [Lachnospiraceae bacterium]|nr:MarR family transcriptional regulator [Lachnospiraceae bacterium]MCI1333908.1 MarR family transcriptional regulator [Lachnospiraceae bacterium]MCI1358077.1 MarR family transcriptional regulator [Lachnospiraceae bacterium]MCI1378013.1 MarR family transcriptional regulator [Lachnospiraceae bacterium]MCI1454669.1 MarR family transcriptional regulator [Lachnospiraceae bacterium]
MRTPYISLNMGVVVNQYQRRINQDISRTEGALTIHQCWILQYLTEHTDHAVRQKEIEQIFSIRRSTANTMLMTMEKNGYIRREDDPDDARAKQLIITEKGRNASERMTDRLKEYDELMLRGISSEELQIFSDILDRMERNIRK